MAQLSVSQMRKKVKSEAPAPKKQRNRGNIYQKLQIFRPVNCILAALALLAGYNIFAPIDIRAMLGSLSAFFVCAGGNSVNDIFDKEIDKINKPWRPIPSGLLSEKEVILGTAVVFALGIILGFITNIQMLIISIIASLTLILYSAKIQRYKFIGNVTIAFLVALLLFTGPLLAGDTGGGLNFAILAGIVVWAREILKDIEENKKEPYTLFEIIGDFGAKAFAAGLIVISLILGINIGLTFTFLRSLTTYLAVSIWAYAVLKINSPHQAQRAIKYGMTLFAIALIMPQV